MVPAHAFAILFEELLFHNILSMKVLVLPFTKKMQVLVLRMVKDLKLLNRHKLGKEKEKQKYHDIELIKVAMYQPMLCQTNDKTKNCVKNIIWIL